MTGEEDSHQREGATMRATESQEMDGGSYCTSSTSVASGTDVYEDDANTGEAVEWEKQEKFLPPYTSDALVAYNPEEAKNTVSIGQERRRSSLELALAKGKRHHRQNSAFPSRLSNDEGRG